MAKLFFSSFAMLLLVASMASVVDIQCNSKGFRVIGMPCDEPPYGEVPSN